MLKQWIDVDKQLPISGAFVIGLNEFTMKEQIVQYLYPHWIYSGLNITHITHWRYAT